MGSYGSTAAHAKPGFPAAHRRVQRPQRVFISCAWVSYTLCQKYAGYSACDRQAECRLFKRSGMSRISAAMQIEKLAHSLSLHASLGGNIILVPSHNMEKPQSSRHSFDRACTHCTWKYLDCESSTVLFFIVFSLRIRFFLIINRSYALFVRYRMNGSPASN